MFEISKDFEFSAAHQIPGHPKCGRMHGHNYKVTVVIWTDELTEGMVIDYALLKELVKPIIDEMDHKYLCGTENQSYTSLSESIQLPIPITTGELLAKYIHNRLYDQMPSGLHIGCIKVCETPNTSATYYPDSEEEE